MLALVLIAVTAWVQAADTPAAPATPIAVSPAPARKLRATFIGNMAVHITDGRVALVSDFPYESGYSGYMLWSADAVPGGPRPLCLITHSHRDHFLASLATGTCGRILGPRDVEQATRVAALAMAPEVRWEDLVIRPLATPHGPLEHYSYVVEWAGTRLYFTGDTDDTTALLAARDLDVAFVSPWLLRAVQARGARIDAGQVVVYHHRGDETVPPFQGRIVPAQGQSLELPHK
jgi:L-ascorbate metabolism protein UlaG (beta-lactamase superfamily)